MAIAFPSIAGSIAPAAAATGIGAGVAVADAFALLVGQASGEAMPAPSRDDAVARVATSGRAIAPVPLPPVAAGMVADLQAFSPDGAASVPDAQKIMVPAGEPVTRPVVTPGLASAVQPVAPPSTHAALVVAAESVTAPGATPPVIAPPAPKSDLITPAAVKAADQRVEDVPAPSAPVSTGLAAHDVKPAVVADGLAPAIPTEVVPPHPSASPEAITPAEAAVSTGNLTNAAPAVAGAAQVVPEPKAASAARGAAQVSIAPQNDDTRSTEPQAAGAKSSETETPEGKTFEAQTLEAEAVEPATIPEPAAVVEVPSIVVAAPLAAPAVATGPSPGADLKQPALAAQQAAAPAARQRVPSANSGTDIAAPALPVDEGATAEAGLVALDDMAPASGGPKSSHGARQSDHEHVDLRVQPTTPGEVQPRIPLASMPADFAALLGQRPGPGEQIILDDAFTATGADASLPPGMSGRSTSDDAGVPLRVLPIEIGLKAMAGVRQFDIRLDPGELGRVDVNLSISEDGEVSAKLVVDRVDTLHLLQRDARALERTFEQAGLKPSEGGIDISLRDQSDQSGQRRTGQDEARPAAEAAAGTEQLGQTIPAQPEPTRRMVRLGGIDVSV